MIMDLFSNLQLLHEAAISVLVTTIYGRWRGTTASEGQFLRSYTLCLDVTMKFIKQNLSLAFLDATEHQGHLIKVTVILISSVSEFT